MHAHDVLSTRGLGDAKLVLPAGIWRTASRATDVHVVLVSVVDVDDGRSEAIEVHGKKNRLIQSRP